MGPLKHYLKDIAREGFVHDSAQEQAVQHLQRLYEELILQQDSIDDQLASEEMGGRAGKKFFKSLSKRLIKSKPKQAHQTKGLYFWGGVGRGKTYLMDCFYDSLPFEEKLRTHFHRFMQRVHSDLIQLQGKKDPLVSIAHQISSKTRVICFDEFFVSDITDAMILAGLFEQLFANGVVLVATSNIIPDDLYKNGLQRARFIPAINLINKHTNVINVDGGTDYRLRALSSAELYYYPINEVSNDGMAKSFQQLAPKPGLKDQVIEINHRQLRTRYCADDVVWFDFDELCDGPRSQNDYIELARIYHAVLLSNVPQMSSVNDDQARRFINLIDEFYDRNVKLVVSASAPLSSLYIGGNVSFEFERTTSRLLEMQSHEYLAREHKP